MSGTERDASGGGTGMSGTERDASGGRTSRSGTGVSRDVYEYAAIRVVPRVERGELINAGVLLYCQPRGYLCARVELDASRLRALDPAADIERVGEALTAYELACGDDAGPLSAESLGGRFRWLTAPRSTIVQTGPVHAGLTADPEAELERLFDRLVRVPAGDERPRLT